jgi:hypothetical protein
MLWVFVEIHYINVFDKYEVYLKKNFLNSINKKLLHSLEKKSSF